MDGTGVVFEVKVRWMDRGSQMRVNAMRFTAMLGESLAIRRRTDGQRTNAIVQNQFCFSFFLRFLMVLDIRRCIDLYPSEFHVLNITEIFSTRACPMFRWLRTKPEFDSQPGRFLVSSPFCFLLSVDLQLFFLVYISLGMHGQMRQTPVQNRFLRSTFFLLCYLNFNGE